MTLRLSTTFFWLNSAVFLGAVACSGGADEPANEENGSGGAASVGGTGGASPGNGGSLGSGGATGGAGSGGLAGTGGSPTGGADGTGGVGDSGGAPSAGGGDMGAGGSPAETYTLSEVGGIYTYSVGDSSMTIDPDNGGRVTSFIVFANETLVQPESPAEQNGSVFWPSPQSLFPNTWPPPAEIDTGSYTVVVSDNQLTLTSPNSVDLGLTVTKTFTPTHSVSGVPAISTVYTMTNTGASVLSVAGWEISRVASGMAFFPTGPGGQLAASTLSGTEIGAHTWYTYDAEGLMDVPKIFADGSGGWLAWSTGEAVVIKSFADVPLANFAPSESEIEIYAWPRPNGDTDASADYFEVEQQGPLETIAPGASATWTVLWIGVGIPDGDDTAAGSEDLVQLVGASL